MKSEEILNRHEWIGGDSVPGSALTFEEESDRYAFRNGLWVLKCQDGITSIANGENFQAQVF